MLICGRAGQSWRASEATSLKLERCLISNLLVNFDMQLAIQALLSASSCSRSCAFTIFAALLMPYLTK